MVNKAAIDAVADGAGTQAGRLAGRAHNVTTKTCSTLAAAPHGRRFQQIFAQGITGLTEARDAHFTGSWLRGDR